jgi:uncharacterized membrane protein YkgB
MSHDQAAGVMADEPRSSRTIAIAALVVRYALVIVIAWFGAMKLTYYESQGISPLIANSPFMSWIYNIMPISAFGRLLGSAELITAALLAAVVPEGFRGGRIFASLFFAGTLSFMITTPGVGEAAAGGFPVLSPDGSSLRRSFSALSPSASSR